MNSLHERTSKLLCQLPDEISKKCPSLQTEDELLQFIKTLMNVDKKDISGPSFFSQEQYLRESLLTALLHALHEHYFPSESTDSGKMDEEALGFSGYCMLGYLAVTGTINSICNGFDGSVSILSLFVDLPFWIVFALGFALSLVYVVLFLGMDFFSMSENLHIHLSQSRQMLDCFQSQTKQVALLIDKSQARFQCVQNDCVADTNKILERQEYSRDDEHQQLQRWYLLLEMLIVYQRHLTRVRDVYFLELQKLYVRLLKGVMVVLAGLLYFNSGFFTGQVFASVILSAFLTAQISLVSWPILLMSCAVGLAVLTSIFLFSDRFNIENLVARWIGLDVDKMSQLPDDTVVVPNETYLTAINRFVVLQQEQRKQLFFLFKKNPGNSDGLHSMLTDNIRTSTELSTANV